jgi:hypothetical protein
MLANWIPAWSPCFETFIIFADYVEKTKFLCLVTSFCLVSYLRLGPSMEKLQLTGQNHGQVFNSRSDRMCTI